MPDYGKRTGRDAFESLERRLAAAERELRRGRGGGLSSFDRGDTLTQPAPVEGQTMIQYDTDEPWYYANGAWRDFCCDVTSSGASLADSILATPGLVGFWKLADAAGSLIARDESVYGHHLGVHPGSPLALPPSYLPFNWQQAPLVAADKSAYGGDYRAMDVSSVALAGWLAGDASGEAWVQRPAGSGGWFFSQDGPVGGSTTTPTGLYLGASSDSLPGRDKLNLYVSGVLVATSTATIGSTLGGTTAPYHVAFTRRSGTWRIYVNGVLQAATSAAVPNTPREPIFHVGHRSLTGGAGGDTADGYLGAFVVDQTTRLAYVAIYASGLTDAQILEHYQLGPSLGNQDAGKTLTADGSGGTTWEYPVAVWVNGA